MNPEWLIGRSTVAVTSGASTPSVITKAVIEYLEQFDELCLDDILDIETSLVGRRYLQDDLMAALSVFDLNR